MAELKFIKRVVSLNGGDVSDPSPDSFFDGEKNAHTFIIAAVRDEKIFKFPSTGVVSAIFLNPRDACISLTGSIVDGAAVVTLTDPCYDLSGWFTLTIDVNGATVYECQSRVRRRSSGNVYDPNNELSIAVLSAEIAEMHSATAAANTAATNANTAAENANAAVGTLYDHVSDFETAYGDVIAPNGISSLLYKTDTYVNGNTHAETALTGFDLYRIPCSESDFVLIYVANHSSVWPSFSSNHAVNYVLSNGTYQQIQPRDTKAPTVNDYFYSSANETYSLIACLVPSGVKAISISSKNGEEGNITYNVNRAYPAIRETKSPGIMAAPYQLTDEIAIKSYLYRAYNSDYKYSWLSEPGYSLALRVHKGDRVVYSNLISWAAYYGAFIPDSAPTARAVQIAVADYIFTESGLLFSFCGTGEAFNGTIFPAVPCAFTGKNGVAFGTSLTYRAQTTGGYLQYLPALLQATVDNQGIGSSCILQHGSYPNMLNAIKGYTGYANKDFCLLEGFVNDWGLSNTLGAWTDTAETTVCGCVRSAINYILTQNPSITLILILDPVGQSYSGVDNSSLAVIGGKTQMEFYNEIVKIAESMGIPCIKLYATSGMNEKTPYMYIDNIHPSAKGSLQTADIIFAAMRNIPLKTKV